jgi:hypothetical protein
METKGCVHVSLLISPVVVSSNLSSYSVQVSSYLALHTRFMTTILLTSIPTSLTLVCLSSGSAMACKYV